MVTPIKRKKASLSASRTGKKDKENGCDVNVLATSTLMQMSKNKGSIHSGYGNLEEFYSAAEYRDKQQLDGETNKIHGKTEACFLDSIDGREEHENTAETVCLKKEEKMGKADNSCRQNGSVLLVGQKDGEAVVINQNIFCSSFSDSGNGETMTFCDDKAPFVCSESRIKENNKKAYFLDRDRSFKGLVSVNKSDNLQIKENADNTSMVIDKGMTANIEDMTVSVLENTTYLEDPENVNHCEKGEDLAVNLKEQINKNEYFKELMKKECDSVIKKDLFEDNDLIAQCEASKVLLKLSGSKNEIKDDSAGDSTEDKYTEDEEKDKSNGHDECVVDAKKQKIYDCTMKDCENGSFKQAISENGRPSFGKEKINNGKSPLFYGNKILNMLTHEKLKNETLKEENEHLKLAINEIKALVKVKNQNISILEQRINFLECEKKMRDADRGMIENGLELVDRLKAVYQEEVRMFCRKMESIKRENTILKGNYDMLKKTVAELLKKREPSKDSY